MANFIVVSPSQSTDGGNSGDLFVFRSGAVSGATLIGGSGSDTIQLLDGGVAGSGASFDTKGGADKLEFSATTLSAAIKAGAGGDTITFSGANTLDNYLAAGAGSDRVELKAGVLTMNGGASIKGGSGADIISGNTGSVFSGASLLMGAGKDTITVTGTSYTSANIVGGGGADVFTLVGDQKDATVKGGAGGDTINISAAIDTGTIELGNGSDVLNLVGALAGTATIVAGGAGADLINLSGSDFDGGASGITIGGGAGNDTLAFNDVASAGYGLAILGGGGNDSIGLASDMHKVDKSAGGAAFSAGNTFATIAGGAGADSITFTGALNGSAGYAGVLAFSATTDSTLASTDVISFNKSAGSQGGFLLDFGGTFATAIGSGRINTNNGISTNSAGFLASAGTNSSIAERASAMDTLLATGQIGAFKDGSGSATYLFVQGGTTDLIAKFDLSQASAGYVRLSATGGDSEFKITFG